MRLLELIADKILDLPLFEMAMERKRAIQIIAGVSIPLCIHLVKYFAFDSLAKDHWLDEIDGYLLKVDQCELKPNNKKFTGSQYYDLLFDGPMGSGADWVSNLIRKLTKGEYRACARTGLAPAEIYEIVEKLLHKISYDIANNKFDTIRDYV